MKKMIPFVLVTLLLFVEVASGTSHKVTDSGFSFSPSTLTINAGDEISFELDGMHNAVQVTKNVWDANGTASSGGFEVPYGGGKITLNSPGTYYYVCQPHSGSAMKGTIVVSSTTGILETVNIQENKLRVYPNPTSHSVNIDFIVSEITTVKIDIIDITGREVKNLAVSDYTPGNQTKSFSLSGLTPGRYLVRYENGLHQNVTPLLINH